MYYRHEGLGEANRVLAMAAAFKDKYPSIVVTLNSDDPAFFGSNVMNEYWLVHTVHRDKVYLVNEL